MSFVVFNSAPALVESAARINSHAASLLESGVVEALEYACVNSFSCVGASTAAYAAGAVVALVGRNEGGKALSRPTVNAVLDSFARRFDPSEPEFHSRAAKVVDLFRYRKTLITYSDIPFIHKNSPSPSRPTGCTSSTAEG